MAQTAQPVIQSNGVPSGAMGNAPATPPPVQQVQSQPETAPDPNSAPEQAPEQSQGLPPELLELPAIQGLIAGAPNAVSMDISNFAKTDAGKLIAQNQQDIQEAGLGFYKSIHGDVGVIYNQLHVHPADLQAADKAGKLTSIAPPWSKVDHALSKAGAAHPALRHAGAPTAPPMATPMAPPQAATGIVPTPGKPLAAQAQSKLLQARIAATQPVAPTGGPVPGGSQLLNRVLRPIV